MARVTVEDCLDNVENRFELVLMATKRARQIARGKDPMVPWENDKPTVVALREIADGLVTPKTLADEAAREAAEAAAVSAISDEEIQAEVTQTLEEGVEKE